MADIKPEIKIDPATTNNNNTTDVKDIAAFEAAFEDDTDLTFPDPSAQAWLVKVPEDLWKAWAEIYKDAPDDTPIEIGKMRLYNMPANEVDPTKQKIQIRLHHNTPQHQNISKNYDLAVTTRDYSNLCIFSEKNLPGHKPSTRSHNSNRPGLKPSGLPTRDQRYGNNKFSGSRSRSAIPKQTSLAPRIQHEALATPVLDATYEADFARKWAAHVTPKEKTAYTEGIDRTGHAGLSSKLGQFATFGLSAHPKGTGAGGKAGGRRSGGAGGKDKAVRMEKGMLLDALQKCFRRYKYWGMKALRAELRQPEAWIKEVLEEIAVLVKSGDFAMNWTLRPDMMDIILEGDEGGVKEETAKVESASDLDLDGGDDVGPDDDDDDADEDEGEFEDVSILWEKG
ncbi:hypothetical protein LTR78_004523 [Recurvomyces mirabilis]|uniref:Transcription initiation factor IIF subunit beta n=1 Tax=Recurvomyces mirabilis TaxID=574656 RepID=A0AAE0WPJ4_9PEZI|nr:hypothetical protein LTR78_004523 [Recurvomyces mirabilis]KAK5152983.1 hypothetical protein LTS14_008091 [Recurvomyces mirabilis]